MGVGSPTPLARVSIWALTILESFLWAWLALLAWVFRDRDLFRTLSPAVTAQRTAIAVLVTGAAILIWIALVLYAERPLSYGWWVLVIVQSAALVTCAILWLLEKSEASRELWVGGVVVAGVAIVLLCTVERPAWLRPPRESLSSRSD